MVPTGSTNGTGGYYPGFPGPPTSFTGMQQSAPPQTTPSIPGTGSTIPYSQQPGSGVGAQTAAPTATTAATATAPSVTRPRVTQPSTGPAGTSKPVEVNYNETTGFSTAAIDFRGLDRDDYTKGNTVRATALDETGKIRTVFEFSVVPSTNNAHQLKLVEGGLTGSTFGTNMTGAPSSGVGAGGASSMAGVKTNIGNGT